MAGDWIKFETSTSDKPEVFVIADSLGIDPDAVVGKLLRVWKWFDEHTVNGNAPSVSKMLLNRITGVNDFCDAVISASWMIEEDGIIRLPNFDRHNGETAKQRAQTAKRVAKHKEKTNGASVTKTVKDTLPKEEKRRDKEYKEKMFNQFWDVWPKKVCKEPASKSFLKLELDDLLFTKIIRAVKSQSLTWNDPKYIPNPSTWLNQKRWDDEINGVATSYSQEDLAE